MKKSEFIEKYGVEEYEEQLRKNKQYMKRYNAEHKEEQAAYDKQRYAENREEINVRQRQYYAEHKEQAKQYRAEYRATRIGRANYLASGYRQMDKQKGFVNITNQVTKEWIVDNIFTKSCIYCGESDWTKLGCDRIDNDKPHTADNVVCCCGNCNNERKKMSWHEFMAMHKKTL